MDINPSTGSGRRFFTEMSLLGAYAADKEIPLFSRGICDPQFQMEVLKLSESPVGRILDSMEARKLVQQIGERKAAYYTLPSQEDLKIPS